MKRVGWEKHQNLNRKKLKMTSETQLYVRLMSGQTRPQWNRIYENEFHGGPETLLRWLETQLGLPAGDFHQADRVTEYAAALDSLGESVISESMAADRWSTASELLARRDELMLAGWDESDSESLPHIVRELARAAADTAPGDTHKRTAVRLYQETVRGHCLQFLTLRIANAFNARVVGRRLLGEHHQSGFCKKPRVQKVWNRVKRGRSSLN